MEFKGTLVFTLNVFYIFVYGKINSKRFIRI